MRKPGFVTSGPTAEWLGDAAPEMFPVAAMSAPNTPAPVCASSGILVPTLLRILSRLVLIRESLVLLREGFSVTEPWCRIDGSVLEKDVDASESS